MSIAAALSSAASGLSAVARQTDVVAGNVANALTPGYARREAILTALPQGGVRIASVERIVSVALLGDYRLAGASLGYSQTVAQFHTTFEAATGIPGDGSSPGDRVGNLESALLSAASRPDSEIRLGAVVRAGADLATGLNDAADALVKARTQADQGIGDDVWRLRSGLTDIATLNKSIIVDRANGRDAAALIDERQRIIDSLSSIVSLREVPRENGRIALFTTGGATLLDGEEPIDLSFVPAGRMGPTMQVGTSPVARLVMDGDEVADSLMTLFAGGSLEARFAVRDRLAPAAQAGLDAFARDLIERFSDPALDTTLSAGAAGLFTDDGGASTPATERGLANRMALTMLLPPDGSGNWRLRDGLGGTTPGDVGNAALLTALADRLTASRITSSAGIPGGARSVLAFAAELASAASTRRVAADGSVARQTAHANALQANLLGDGVDTDQQMQRLLALENAYSANAKVIMAADEMIARILEL